MSRYRFVITAIMPEFRFMARNLYGKIAGPICGLIPEKEERGEGGSNEAFDYCWRRVRRYIVS